jgi:biofilm protein TabA
MHRFTLRSKSKVDVHWMQFAVVHNIGKICVFGGGLVPSRQWILRSLPHSLPKTSLLSVFQDVSSREKGFFDSLVGRIDLDGDRLYVLVQEYETNPPEQGKWEAHRRYIDVQYVASGRERMGFANLSTMQLGEDKSEKDFQGLSGTGNFLDIFSGAFVIFFPEDGHMPCLCVEQPEPVRKVVLKVRCAA